MPQVDIHALKQFSPLLSEFKDRFVHLIGSAGSGKSFHACLHLLLVMLKYKNTHALIVRRWEKEVRVSIWEQCKKIAYKYIACSLILSFTKARFQ